MKKLNPNAIYIPMVAEIDKPKVDGYYFTQCKHGFLSSTYFSIEDNSFMLYDSYGERFYIKPNQPKFWLNEIVNKLK